LVVTSQKKILGGERVEGRGSGPEKSDAGCRLESKPPPSGATFAGPGQEKKKRKLSELAKYV